MLSRTYKKVNKFGILMVFFFNTIFMPNGFLYAQEFKLPKPGTLVGVSTHYSPAILRGIKLHQNNPLKFEFIVDNALKANQSRKSSRNDINLLIKYFLTSLTIPENDLWVNLSPYEKNRIVPNAFGLTEMGRDLLAEDYFLKQITASFLYPEGDVGKKFWSQVYHEAFIKYGTTNIPVNTFNKVWILPDKAVVYENLKAQTAYVVESNLKVMLEEDYLALTKSLVKPNDTHKLGSSIIRDIVLPALSVEINKGHNFAKLRQIYNSLILAMWYKKKIKDSVLMLVYANKAKIEGARPRSFLHPPNFKETDVNFIYQNYLKAFKKGVFNYIKDDLDPVTQQAIPRKYFSGGDDFTHLGVDGAMVIKEGQIPIDNPAQESAISAEIQPTGQSLDEIVLNDFNQPLGLELQEYGFYYDSELKQILWKKSEKHPDWNIDEPWKPRIKSNETIELNVKPKEVEINRMYLYRKSTKSVYLSMAKINEKRIPVILKEYKPGNYYIMAVIPAEKDTRPITISPNQAVSNVMKNIRKEFIRRYLSPPQEFIVTPKGNVIPIDAETINYNQDLWNIYGFSKEMPFIDGEPNQANVNAQLGGPEFYGIPRFISNAAQITGDSTIEALNLGDEINDKILGSGKHRKPMTISQLIDKPLNVLRMRLGHLYNTGKQKVNQAGFYFYGQPQNPIRDEDNIKKIFFWDQDNPKGHLNRYFTNSPLDSITIGNIKNLTESEFKKNVKAVIEYKAPGEGLEDSIVDEIIRNIKSNGIEFKKRVRAALEEKLNIPPKRLNLFYNPGLYNFFHRHPANKLRSVIADFLAENQHQLVNAELDSIQNMDDNEVLTEINNELSKEHAFWLGQVALTNTVSIQELMLRPSEGKEDLSQMFTTLNAVSTKANVEQYLEQHHSDESKVKKQIRKYALILRSIEILSSGRQTLFVGTSHLDYFRIGLETDHRVDQKLKRPRKLHSSEHTQSEFNISERVKNETAAHFSFAEMFLHMLINQPVNTLTDEQIKSELAAASNSEMPQLRQSIQNYIALTELVAGDLFLERTKGSSIDLLWQEPFKNQMQTNRYWKLLTSVNAAMRSKKAAYPDWKAVHAAFNKRLQENKSNEPGVLGRENSNLYQSAIRVGYPMPSNQDPRTKRNPNAWVGSNNRLPDPNWVREHLKPKPQSPKTGGIDLTRGQLPLDIQESNNSGKVGLKFNLTAAKIAQLQQATGFEAVILDNKPLKDLKSFLEIATP